MRCQELIDETMALREQLESKQQQEKKTKRDREAQLKSDLEKALVANSVSPLPAHAHVRIIMLLILFELVSQDKDKEISRLQGRLNEAEATAKMLKAVREDWNHGTACRASAIDDSMGGLCILIAAGSSRHLRGRHAGASEGGSYGYVYVVAVCCGLLVLMCGLGGSELQIQRLHVWKVRAAKPNVSAEVSTLISVAVSTCCGRCCYATGTDCIHSSATMA